MLSALGFQKKTYDEHLADLEQLARQLFGDDANLSENGPLGKFIRLQAFARAEESELAEAIYLSASIDHAEGAPLDYVAKNFGLTRLPSLKARGTVNMTVTPGATIPAGTILATADGIEFVTLASVTDGDNNGLLDSAIEARLGGVSGNVPANTIKVVNTPTVGLQTVNNTTATIGGQDTETDKELRDRHATIGANSLSSTVNGIRTAILNEVPGASSAVVIENAEATTVDGRPPKSFEAIVYGGTAENVAKTILKAKPAGIQAFGTQNIQVADDSGTLQRIGFSFAQAVMVFVKADVTVDASFPVDGIDRVKQAVVEHIGGTDPKGVQHNGLNMGNSVINSQVAFAIIRNVPGVLDVAITFSTNGTTYTGGNFAITSKQVAQTDVAKVAVI